MSSVVCRLKTYFNSIKETFKIHPWKYDMVSLCFVVFLCGSIVPMSPRDTSLALEHWHLCLSVHIILTNVAEWFIRVELKCPYTRNKTKHNKTVSIFHDDVIKWKHFPCYWAFVRGIHRLPVNSLHKGQWRGALMLSFVCTLINGWVNNREAGDLTCYLAHYDVTVMSWDVLYVSVNWIITLLESGP